MVTTLRTLRLGPVNVMTGDILVEKAYGGGVFEDVVTNVEPIRDGNGASLWRITTVRSKAVYAAQRRVTVKRSGPKGLGE